MMIRIYTSCYFHPKVWGQLNDGRADELVVISKSAPEAFSGVERCPPLIPVYRPGDEFWRAKYDLQLRDVIDWEEILPDLNGRVLLCWERDNADCHRGMLADYLKTVRPDVEVIELATGPKTKKLF